MEGREPDSLNRELVAGQHHYWEVSSCAEIPHFNSVIGGPSCNEVLILVKVHRKYFVVVCVDFLYVLPRAEIPNTRSLVSTTAAKNALVSRMPESLVHGKLVQK